MMYRKKFDEVLMGRARLKNKDLTEEDWDIILENGLPKKICDPGNFVLPVRDNGTTSLSALADTRASVSVLYVPPFIESWIWDFSSLSFQNLTRANNTQAKVIGELIDFLGSLPVALKNNDWGSEGYGAYKKIEGDGAWQAKFEVKREKVHKKFQDQRDEEKALGVPRLVDWNIFADYDCEDDLLDMIKINYMHEDGDVFEDHSWENVFSNKKKSIENVIMEYLVKIRKKARILKLKQRHLKITVLTSNTSYPSRKIRRICACTSLKTTKEQDPIRRIQRRPIRRIQNSSYLGLRKKYRISLKNDMPPRDK
ncbi:hypothetical protein Tco_0078633 [Tanacetum coccineum]